MRQFLPDPVFDAIQRHLIRQGNAAEDGWEAGQDEEDTLTGHLGAHLQRRWSRPIQTGEYRWRWRVRYKKFRGRGGGAYEKLTGADGIVQIEIDLLDEAEIITKGVLFQAKKGDLRKNKKFQEQVENMESFAPEGSAVFLYRPDRYRAIEGHKYLQQLKDKVLVPRDGGFRLGDYLGKQFLPCESGILGMYYDAERKILIVPEEARASRMLKVRLQHRVSVEVERTAQ